MIFHNSSVQSCLVKCFRNATWGDASMTRGAKSALAAEWSTPPRCYHLFEHELRNVETVTVNDISTTQFCDPDHASWSLELNVLQLEHENKPAAGLVDAL